MLTAGDVEYEPTIAPVSGGIPGIPEPQYPYPPFGSKMVPVTNSIIALTAGDAALQSQLLQDVQAIIIKRLQEDNARGTPRWLDVKEVADVYRSCYEAASRDLASRQFLAPLSLTFETFISRQKEFSDQSVKDISTELIHFEMEPVEVIFAGVDSTGSHIYTVDNDSMACRDSIGFATIGSGGWHPSTQFMLAGHDRKSAPTPETLFLTFLAKTRSEVAPGVGKGTDMFSCGPVAGTCGPIYGHILAELDKIYSTHAKMEEQVFVASRKATQKYVEEIQKQSTEHNKGTQDIPKISNQPTPVERAELQVGTEEKT